MALRPIPNEQRPKPIARVPIVEADGKPAPFFSRQWQNLVNLVTSVIELQDDSETNAANIAINKAAIQTINDTEIIAGTGLTGGGLIGGGDVTLNADIQALLDSISDVHGSVLFRGAADWAALGPGTVDYVLATKGAGADPEWVEQTGGGGGGGAWELIGSSTIAAPVSSVDFTNLSGYSDLMFVFEAVTASAGGQRIVLASVDNGASYFNTSGDYQSIASSGALTANTSVALNDTSTLAATTAVGYVKGNVAGYKKIFQRPQRTTNSQFAASTAVIDAVRFANSSGNLNGGVVHLLGRP